MDKIKIAKNAEKYLAQGDVRSAIKEYRKIVEKDPKDAVTLNTLGDLYIREKDIDKAVECFSAAAEIWTKQGFIQKGIAVYTKILRYRPGDISVSHKLADLYRQKGLLAEARNYYSAVAEHYKKEGRRDEALAIWKIIAELDPNSAEVHLKIGEACVQENQLMEAVNAFVEAGNKFFSREQLESALYAYRRAIDINKDEWPALSGLVKTQIKLGYTDEAIIVLEEAQKRQPYNREILLSLLECYLDLNNPTQAEQTVIKLVEQEPSSYPKFLDVVKAYLKASDTNGAARVLSMTSEHLLASGQAQELSRWINEILAKNPEELEALRLLVRLCFWQKDERQAKSALERLLEAAKLQGSVEDQKQALLQLTRIVPYEQSYQQQLQAILAKEASEARTKEPPVESLKGAFYTPQASYQQEKDFAFTDIIERFGESPSGFGYEEFQEELAYGTKSNENTTFDYQELYQQPTLGSPDILEDIPENIDILPPQKVEPEKTTQEKLAQLTSFDKLDQLKKAKIKEEIEAIEYFINLGCIDIAAKTLASLEKEYGSLPEIEPLKSSILSKTGATTVGIQETPETLQVTTEELGKTEVKTTSEELVKAKPEKTEQRAVESIETKFIETAPIEKEFIETSKVAEAQPIGPTETKLLEVKPVETSKVKPVEKRVEPTSLIEDICEELGLEIEETTETGDYDTRYQLGIAFREMGLLEDAISEFQEAVKMVSPKDGTKRYFHCCNMLGLCFMEKHLPNIALMWYHRAMETENLTEDELQGLRYEIANAYEASGEKERAREFFEQIYAIDVHYRDVGQRLAQLQNFQQKSSQEEKYTF
jgi:tetratricopeptide (TPR) repeat protein